MNHVRTRPQGKGRNKRISFPFGQSPLQGGSRRSAWRGAGKPRRIKAVAATCAVTIPLVAFATTNSLSSGESRPSASTRPAAQAQDAPSRFELRERMWPAVNWRRSSIVGRSDDGRLGHGVLLPPEGRDWFTYDPDLGRIPNRRTRRYGADTTIEWLLGSLAAFRRHNRSAPPIGVGDLSRPGGGRFGGKYGPSMHVTHQSGTSIDIYYPRADHERGAPFSAWEIDRKLSNRLITHLLARGAERIYVGPSTRLARGGGKVRVLGGHDTHLHVESPKTFPQAAR